MNREETIDLIKRVSNNLKNIKNTSINEVCRIGIIDVENWEWAQGVGMEMSIKVQSKFTPNF